MTLVVPLSVRLVTARQDRHVTRNLRELEFRSVVPGGFASLRMAFDKPLHIQPSEVDYYAGVYVYGPDGGTVWEGRLEDPGRGVGSDGLVWDMAAVGPSAHAEDLVRPVIYIDQSLDRWTRRPATMPALETNSQSAQNEAEPGWQLRFPRGTVVPIGNALGIEYLAMLATGQKVARYSYRYDMGVVDASLLARLEATYGLFGLAQTVVDIGWTTTAASESRTVVTDFDLLRDRLSWAMVRQTSALNPVANDDTWALLTQMIVVALRWNADGTLKTSGYTTDSVLASDVVADALARFLPRYDGINALIETTSYAIQSLAYPDSTTARNLFDDLIGLEPAYYWAAWESGQGGRTPTLIALDTFIRTAVSSWTQADTEQTWTNTNGAAADYFVSGGRGRQSAASTGVLRTSSMDLGVTDVQVQAWVNLDTGTIIGANATTRLYCRSTDANNYYAALVTWDTADVVQLRIIRFVGGVQTVLAGPVNIFSGFGAGLQCAIAFEVSGSRLAAKAWIPSLQPEPEAWYLAVTDTTITSGTRGGVVSRLDSGNTNPLPVQFQWANFRSTGPAGLLARHRFEWRSWPTTVRYEADVSDGFDSPGSGQGLWNRARVRYRDVRGRGITVLRTQTVQELTDAGLDREAFLDIGNDRTTSDANQAGDVFLAEHRTPPNAGTLTIARPVVDLVAGGMAQPYEIRPGSLIRVRGVLPRVDNLNATDRDGLTVFRIVGVTYRASDATAQLELDSYPLTVAQALAALKRGR